MTIEPFLIFNKISHPHVSNDFIGLAGYIFFLNEDLENCYRLLDQYYETSLNPIYETLC